MPFAKLFSHRKQKESLSLSSSNHHPPVKENIENSESYFITTGVTVTNGDTDEVKADLFDVIENSQFWLVANWRSIFVQIEYAWVSQEEVTAKSSGFWDDSYKKEPTAKYDLKIEHNIPDSFVLKAQETFNIVFEITNTNPVTHLEFDISEMLGDADALSFGLPSVVFGEAYRHDDIEETPYSEGKLIHLDPIVSSSGEFQFVHFK